MANGTDGRVYGGDPELVHVPDGRRTEIGLQLADIADDAIRMSSGDFTRGMDYAKPSKPLCPGCYMVVGFNMLVALARENRQSLSELGNTMSQAFLRLADCGESLDSNGAMACIEEIEVILDPGTEDISEEDSDERYSG